MNSKCEVASAPLKREQFVTVAGVEYSVEISAPSPENEGHVQRVEVRRYEADLKWWRYVASGQATDTSSELESIREVFRQSRYQMRKWIRYWQDNRMMAAEEKGGKKAYYTKHANQCYPQILKYAAEWKLMKAIWKEMTRL